MDSATGTEERSKAVVNGIVGKVKLVITNPVEFYRTMPKTGGFGDPLVFLAVLAAVSAVVRAVLGLLHISGSASIGMAIGSIIGTPIAAAIFGFVGAAIVFVIWKIMGSSENYETAYRCMAYSAAIMPIAAVAGVVPYVGALVGLAWGLYLNVTASVEVHKIAVKKAWLVFGILAAIAAMFSISGQIAVRRAQTFGENMKSMSQSMKGVDGKNVTPEDAGRAAAEFMRGFEKEAKKAQAEAAKP